VRKPSRHHLARLGVRGVSAPVSCLASEVSRSAVAHHLPFTCGPCPATSGEMKPPPDVSSALLALVAWMSEQRVSAPTSKTSDRRAASRRRLAEQVERVGHPIHRMSRQPASGPPSRRSRTYNIIPACRSTAPLAVWAQACSLGHRRSARQGRPGPPAGFAAAHPLRSPRLRAVGIAQGRKHGIERQHSTIPRPP